MTFFASHNSKRLLIQSSGWDAATHYNFIENIKLNSQIKFNDYPKLFHYYLAPLFNLVDVLIKSYKDNVIIKVSLLSLFVNLIVILPYYSAFLNFFYKNKLKAIIFLLFFPFYFEIISKISVQGHYAQLLNNFFILNLMNILILDKNNNFDIFEKILLFISVFYSYYFFYPAFFIFFILFFTKKISSKFRIKNYLKSFLITLSLSLPVILGFLNIKSINSIITVWGGVENLNSFEQILFLLILFYSIYVLYKSIKKRISLNIYIISLIFGLLSFSIFLFIYQKLLVKVISYSFYKILLSTYLIILFNFLLFSFINIKKDILLVIFTITFTLYLVFSEKRLVHFFKGTFNFMHPHVYNTALLLLEENFPRNFLIHPILSIEQTYWAKRIFEKKYKVNYNYLIYNQHDEKINRFTKDYIIFDPTYKLLKNNEIIIYPKR